ERHPCGSVGLFQNAAVRQGLRAVENADVVKSEKTTREDLLAADIFTIHPPGEVDQQLVEHAFEECIVPFVARRRDLVNAPGCPRVYRRVFVAERELVRRNLAARMRVPL